MNVEDVAPLLIEIDRMGRLGIINGPLAVFPVLIGLLKIEPEWPELFLIARNFSLAIGRMREKAIDFLVEAFRIDSSNYHVLWELFL